MKKKCIILAASFMFVGCANSGNIEYVETNDKELVDNTEDTATVATYSNNEWNNENINGAKWDEQFTVKSTDNNEYTIKLNTVIDAEYDLENISVYEFECVNEITPETKKRIVTGIFDEGKIYRFENEYCPKEYWRDRVNYCDVKFEKLKKEWGSELNSEQIRAYENEKQYYEDFIKDAPDEYIEAETFSGYIYLGYIDGHPYQIEFLFQNHINDMIKQGFTFVDGASVPLYNIQLSLVEELDNNMPTEGESTTVKAEEVTENLLNKMGIDEVNKVELIDRKGYILVGSDLRVGYIQGLADADIEDRDIFADEREYISQNTEEIELESGEKIRLNLLRDHSLIWSSFDKGLLNKILIQSYMELKDIKNKVPMLAFSDVSKIIKNELESRPEYYETKGTKLSYDKLELIYIDIASDDGNTCFNIPYWKLSSSFTLGKSILVNAMDGTILEK